MSCFCGRNAIHGIADGAFFGPRVLRREAQTRLVPITHTVLREAARLRATTKLKTPDALHLATAQNASCALFITNDGGFRSVAGLPIAILDDLLKP